MIPEKTRAYSVQSEAGYSVFVFIENEWKNAFHTYAVCKRVSSPGVVCVRECTCSIA